jgi:hypothetical protein
MAEEYFQTSTKKGRGRAQRSLDLIDAMYDIAEQCQPITGRGIGYKLFTAGLIPSMATSEMSKVYRLLKEAREEGAIPWEWIVDETRSLERVATWDNPKEYVEAVGRSYRRDFWNQQPVRVEVWSEKGTVRGVLQPVLDEYGIGFRVFHGFSGATSVYDIAQDDDGRDLIALYCGDYDPSGMCMSEDDLPNRLDKYGGHHVSLNRIAILSSDLARLPTFPASDKEKDRRYPWFLKNHGGYCCELDAMDPNELRDRVEEAIRLEIDDEKWERCEILERAEKESIRNVLNAWKESKGGV